LKYLHEEKQILHRDIKPANILWYDGGRIKITDFNHAIELEKLIEFNWRGNVGTPWFKAPELLLDLKYSFGIDVWALGCVFEHLLTQQFIFRFDANAKKGVNYNQNQNLIAIFRKLGIPSGTNWASIAEFDRLKKPEY